MSSCTHIPYCPGQILVEQLIKQRYWIDFILDSTEEFIEVFSWNRSHSTSFLPKCTSLFPLDPAMSRTPSFVFVMDIYRTSAEELVVEIRGTARAHFTHRRPPFTTSYESHLRATIFLHGAHLLCYLCGGIWMLLGGLCAGVMCQIAIAVMQDCLLEMSEDPMLASSVSRLLSAGYWCLLAG